MFGAIFLYPQGRDSQFWNFTFGYYISYWTQYFITVFYLPLVFRIWNRANDRCLYVYDLERKERTLRVRKFSVILFPLDSVPVFIYVLIYNWVNMVSSKVSALCILAKNYWMWRHLLGLAQWRTSCHRELGSEISTSWPWWTKLERKENHQRGIENDKYRKTSTFVKEGNCHILGTYKGTVMLGQH